MYFASQTNLATFFLGTNLATFFFATRVHFGINWHVAAINTWEY